MCNELLKNAFRFHFCGVCRSFYTLRPDSRPVLFQSAYKNSSQENEAI